MKCKKCGNELNVDTSIVLTSYPTKYNAYCPMCDEHRYVFCEEYDSELDRLKFEEYFNGQLELDREYLVKLINEVIDERLKGEPIKPKPATLIIREGNNERIIEPQIEGGVN